MELLAGKNRHRLGELRVLVSSRTKRGGGGELGGVLTGDGDGWR
jgi:hypothetical protein